MFHGLQQPFRLQIPTESLNILMHSQ